MKHLLALLIVALLSACGGGGDEEDTQPVNEGRPAVINWDQKL